MTSAVAFPRITEPFFPEVKFAAPETIDSFFPDRSVWLVATLEFASAVVTFPSWDLFFFLLLFLIFFFFFSVGFTTVPCTMVGLNSRPASSYSKYTEYPY